MTNASIRSKLTSLLTRLARRAPGVAAAARCPLPESLESRTLFAVAFQPIAYYSVADRPESLAAGDLNGDGRADMVTTSLLRDRVSLLINQPDGSFVNTENLEAPNPRAVATADFNGDGNIDIVLTTSRGTTRGEGGVSVLLGNGNGTFQPRVRYNLDNAGRAISAADVNGDARPDLVISANEKLAVLLNLGNGTFGERVKYKGLESRTTEVIVADVNSDGAPDLLAATPRRSGITILFGNLAAPGVPAGTFGEPVVAFAGRDPVTVATGDFNADGKVDLAVGNSGFRVSGLSVLLGNGDGTFQPRNPYASKNFSESVVVGDFTGDGIADIALGSAVGPYQFYTGDNTGNFTLTDELVGGGSRARGVDKTVAADFNVDGKLDLASIVYRRNRIGVRLSQ